MKIIVTTSNSMSYLMAPFCALWEKHGGPKPITVLHYEIKPKNLPTWCETAYIGIQTRSWVDSVSKYIRELEEDEFILTTEDSFLNTEFHNEAYEVCLKLIDNCDKVQLYGNIYANRIQYLNNINHVQCFKILPDFYPTALCPSIWKKDAFLKCCAPGDSIWHFEMHYNGENKKANKISVLATNPSPIIYQNFMTRGKINMRAVWRFTDDDMKIINNFGIRW